MSAHTFMLDVFAAGDVTISAGVMQGETLSIADEMVLDDMLRLAPGAVMHPVQVESTANGLRRAEGAGNAVHLDCCLTLMAPDGSSHDALVLVEVAETEIVSLFLLPIGELMPATAYRLVGVERHTATRRFAEAASGSFARGTRIALASGQMRAVEELSPGDLLLTRDAGRQPLRHICQTTLRATGSFAPVVITAGALSNERDLVLRPDHRLFIYQRTDALGAGRAEVMVKARHLVDHVTVLRRRGGYVDYFQLILDHHHIIYAEGIAAESHLVDPRTRPALPAGVTPPDHARTAHQGYEIKSSLIPAKEATALLRQASRS